MARRHLKKRTHISAKNGAPPSGSSNPKINDPKSMVIRIGAGEVGSSVSQLVLDVRKVLEPGTASRLRERRGNKLRDYVTMCGPLNVSHLLLFSRSESGNTNLRVALAPRGPTLNFRVEQYSLIKDVQRIQKYPRGGGKEYATPPLLVMNNFITPHSTNDSKVPRNLETLATTVFQSLFPPINPQVTPLKSIKRVLLLNREQEDDGSFIINFRHFVITTRSTGVSKAVRRLHNAERLIAPKTSRKGTLPNLSRLEDIADYMIGGDYGDGYATDATSGSELDTDAEVEVLEPARYRLSENSKGGSGANAEGNGATEVEVEKNVERKAVKLVELGPRMRLRLTKVEEGLCSGRIMWHEYINKSKSEVKELERRWDKRKQEKDTRRREQMANVEKKRKAKGEVKGIEGGANDGEMDVDDYEYFTDDLDGVEGGEDEDGEDEMEDVER